MYSRTLEECELDKLIKVTSPTAPTHNCFVCKGKC